MDGTVRFLCCMLLLVWSELSAQYKKGKPTGAVYVYHKKILINKTLCGFCFMYRTNKLRSIDSHVYEIQVTDGRNEIRLKNPS